MPHKLRQLQIRTLEISDFGFVRRLASKQRNFTKPPQYVLWLLQKAHSDSCFIAEHVRLGPIAYLLSLVIATSNGKGLYVWQLAASLSGQQTGATHALLLSLRTYIRRKKIRKIFFTAAPGTSEFRAIRRYSYALFGNLPRLQEKVPKAISRDEHEFVIDVRR
jgi:hypothetical protein